MPLTMKLTAKIGAAALAMAVAAPAASFAQSCGGEYTVQRGDTLSRIAANFYGTGNQYQIIYSANADTIGSNPAFIEVGQKFFIPCLDNVKASRADSSAITQLMTTNALPAPNDRAIRFVVGSD